MKLVTYSNNGKEQLAFYIQDMLYAVTDADSTLPGTMTAMLQDWEANIGPMRQAEADIKANGSNYELSYFVLEQDAINDVNAIPDPTAYESATGSVWVRVVANSGTLQSQNVRRL